MTGTVVVHKTQVGQSGTAANNFTIRTLDDGSLRISRGNAGAETSDPLKIEANGNVSLLPTASLSGKNQCTAWVSFNGTGTVAIRDSFNVSSITDNGTGDYTVNFATAMNNANYAFCSGTIAQAAGGVSAVSVEQSFGTAPSTTALRINTKQTGTFVDSANICISIFGG